MLFYESLIHSHFDESILSRISISSLFQIQYIVSKQEEDGLYAD